MGRYKISIEKYVGLNPEKPVTRVEVIGLLRKAEMLTEVDVPVSPDEAAVAVDVDGNLSPAVVVDPPPDADELVKFASFEVTDPVARFIKIVTCSAADSSPCLIWEACSATKSEKDESVLILHKRKSAGRVRSFYEATSDLMNKKGENAGSDVEFEGNESEEEQMPEEPAPKGKLSTFRVDLMELKNPGKVILRVDTERDLVDYEGGTTIVIVLNVDDENGNSQEIQTSAPSAEEEPIPANELIPAVTLPAAETETGPDEVTPEAEAPEKVDQGAKTPPSDSPITMSITVANDLMIFVELDNTFASIDVADSAGVVKDVVPCEAAQETSTQSLVEPDTLFYLPYQNIFLDGLPATRSKSQRIPSYLQQKDQPEREERKKLLRKLILERLLAFGTPNVTAHDITDTWYSGYVQHRALSYRIPKMRVVSKGSEEKEKVEACEAYKPVKIKLGRPLPESAGFVESFIYHSNYFKGILNSATCTALECTFYLMLPHFKTQTEKNAHYLPGAGISPSFIRDWISLITTAAYQLKPSEPAAISALVKKETKLTKSLLASITKENKRMKERLQYIRDKVEILKEKTHERIKLDPELAIEVQRDEEPTDYGGFAHLQLVGFTGPEIFPNFLHFFTGKFGLFLKKEAEEAWFPFSDLNFLERRVIFLGLMDHLHSSFEAVLTTIRHLEEIYTPGYPMNLLTRLKPLFEIISRPKPYQLLATESKLALYGAACGCLGALKRFKYVYKELIMMVKDASSGLDKLDYNAVAEFHAKLGNSDKLDKVNLIVPFPTLNLEQFHNLSERGTSVSLDEKQK